LREGRAWSQQVLHVAESMDHVSFKAKAQLFLTFCDRLLSRYHRAHHAIQHSALG